MKFLLNKKAMLLTAMVVSFVVSQFAGHINSYYLQVILSIGINITLAVRLNLINGYTGQFSLGDAGVMAIGAYVSAYLSKDHGAGVLRMKGLVATTDDPSRPVVLHGVQHVMHPPGRLDAWPDEDHDTRLVFILKDLDPELVEGLWRAAAGEPAVDRADLAANPLAPAPSGLLA